MSAPLRQLVAAVAIVSLAAAAGWAGWRFAHKAPAALDSGGYSFRLPMLDGQLVGPGDFAGEVVLLDYWATWCGPCHVQSRILAQLREELLADLGEDAGVRFLAVNVAEDELTVRSFVEDSPFPYPVLLDRDGSVSERAGVYGLPTVTIYGRQGELVFQQAGITGKRALRRVIEGALSTATAGAGL